MAVKRYDGSAWQTVAGLGAQGPAATSSSIATWVKTATGGETSVSGNDDNSQPLSYTVGQELVFINGALQKRGADYTATTGNSITGLTALAANDVVTVWTVNAFSVTNAISNTLVDAKGDLIVATGADTPGRLAVGSNNQVLTADSTTGTGLKWATPAAGGGMTLIETLSPSGVASVTTASIAGTYKHLLLVVKGVYASTNTDFYLRMNGDTGNNYTYSRVNITATPAFTGSVTSATSEIRFSDIANVTGYNQVVSGYFWIYRYPDTDHTFGNGGFIAEDGVRKATYINGLYNNSAAITTLTLGVLSGTMTDGDIWVYGVN